MRKFTLAILLASLLVLAADAGPAVAAPPGTSRIAELVFSQTLIYEQPEGRVERAMSPETGYGPRIALRVLSVRTDAAGRRWYRVLLPTRPNGSTGWVRADRVHTRWTGYRIQISTYNRRLQLLYNNRVVLRTGVVVGKRSTPTPAGQFAVYANYLAPRTPLAPRVMELTAHSNVLHEYAGGPGRVAIHGRAGPLWAPVGTALSNGCIRVPSRALNRIGKMVPLGTPVEITHRSLSWLNRR